MYRIHCIIHLLIALILGIAAVAAHAQAPAPGFAATATLRGHIADPTGALIPGAKITVTDATGKTVATTTADAAGAYTVNGLAPGSYIVRAEFAGFAPFQSQPIPLTAGQAKRVDVAMAIEVEQQSVEVTDETPQVNVEAGGNANALIIKGKDLEAFSDDPDELSNELQALAGPSAGPNGGQVYIDGFSGGQLPPKSAIREIRINQNPFSAEFDKLGYGRIEIFTKPGTDKFHGQFSVLGNDSAFNTRNPFLGDAEQQPYDSVIYQGNIGGPINKKASFFLDAQRRNIDEIAIVDAQALGLTESVPNPRTRTNIGPRIDYQLTPNNSLGPLSVLPRHLAERWRRRPRLTRGGI